MVDTRAKFHIASTHGDWITIESRVESFKRSSFEVTHKVFKGEALAIEAFETRVLVGRHPDDPGAAEIGAGAGGNRCEIHAGLIRRTRRLQGVSSKEGAELATGF